MQISSHMTRLKAKYIVAHRGDIIYIGMRPHMLTTNMIKLSLFTSTLKKSYIGHTRIISTR